MTSAASVPHFATLPRMARRAGADHGRRTTQQAASRSSTGVRSSLGIECNDVGSISSYFDDIKKQKFGPQRGFFRPELRVIPLLVPLHH
eukprot:746189-Hanusia_phi.AAC.2